MSVTTLTLTPASGAPSSQLAAAYDFPGCGGVTGAQTVDYYWDAISAGTDPTDLYYEVPVLWLNTNNIGLYKGPAYPTIQAIFTGGYSGGVSL